ncbi:MAG: ribosome maturation factor RimM, partial [Dehalococcoidia bacterium]
PGFVSIGRILGAWGVHGALKIAPLTDFPERFAAGASLWIAGAEYHVERSHWQRGIVVAKLRGIEIPEAAADFQGSLVELPESQLRPLAEDEYYQHDLIGLAVWTISGDDLGRVVELLPTGANHVLVVRGERGEYLVPLIATVVQTIDLTAGQITVELLEGLEPTPMRPPRPPRPSRKVSQ